MQTTYYLIRKIFKAKEIRPGLNCWLLVESSDVKITDHQNYPSMIRHLHVSSHPIRQVQRDRPTFDLSSCRYVQ
ncbi:Uncharacterized protein APZ42_001861 [Daphnia magna]|uniref:Uncharacterized protein n=1 Tax=Daphnia magna TaxID=35525 RepID=A0A164IPE3_9CRUS|nr:Uncharacterized protein APZ42_001861 [Daphnia magna]